MLSLASRRVMALALGYEDLNDHDYPARDPMLAVAVRKKDFCYKTRDSWRWQRRVTGKAGHPGKGANPRFIVTSLWPAPYEAQALYEKIYCARGDMENRQRLRIVLIQSP